MLVLYHRFFEFLVLLSDKVLFFHLFLLFFLVTTHQLIEGFGVVIVNVFVDSSFKPLHEFFFDLLLDVGSYQGLCFSYPISFFCFFLDGDDLFFALQLQLSHLDDHLPQFGQSLFAFVNDKWGPIQQLLVDLLEGLIVGLIETHFFPELVGEVGSFSSLHVEIAHSLFLSNSGVLRVGQRTTLPIAETGQIVLVSAEVLRVGSASPIKYLIRKEQCLFLMTFHTT